MYVADVLAKDKRSSSDLWRSSVRRGLITLASENEVLIRRAEEKGRRQDLALRGHKQEQEKKNNTRAGNEKVSMDGTNMEKALYGLDDSPTAWYYEMQKV